jgi:hypothetical protein
MPEQSSSSEHTRTHVIPGINKKKAKPPRPVRPDAASIAQPIATVSVSGLTWKEDDGEEGVYDDIPLQDDHLHVELSRVDAERLLRNDGTIGCYL